MSISRDSSRRPEGDVQHRRAVLFVDYMNAREVAYELYAELYASQHPDRNNPSGDFHPRKLGEVICDEYNKYRRGPDAPSLKLAEVRVYCGVHDRDQDNPKHIERLDRERAWADLPEQGVIVSVVGPPIQYPHGWHASERERKAPVEKEVDAAIAADMVAMALDEQFDVAIVFSDDADMRPPVCAVLDPTTSGRKTGVYCFGWAHRGKASERERKSRILDIPKARIPVGADFQRYPLWFDHYDVCADDTNYLRRRLQDYHKGAIVTGKVIRQLKTGGLVVAIDHDVLGFLPKGELADDVGNGHLGDYVDQALTVAIKRIVDDPSQLDHGDLPVILSERVAVRAEQKDRMFGELREGEIREGRITGIKPFGVFVDLGGVDGLARRSELSWDRNVDPEQMFTIGQRVNVYIKTIDKESKKIGLSIRRASLEEGDSRQRAINRNTQRTDTRAVLGDQGETDKHAHAYVHGEFVPARVTRVLPDGVKVQTIHGDVGDVEAHDLVRGRKPSDVVAEGDILPLVVRLLQPLGLGLVEEHSEEGRKAKGDGWRFNTDGRLVVPPDNVTKQFQDQHD